MDKKVKNQQLFQRIKTKGNLPVLDHSFAPQSHSYPSLCCPRTLACVDSISGASAPSDCCIWPNRVPRVRQRAKGDCGHGICSLVLPQVGWLRLPDSQVAALILQAQECQHGGLQLHMMALCPGSPYTCNTVNPSVNKSSYCKCASVY